MEYLLLRPDNSLDLKSGNDFKGELTSSFPFTREYIHSLDLESKRIFQNFMGSAEFPYFTKQLIDALQDSSVANDLPRNTAGIMFEFIVINELSRHSQQYGRRLLLSRDIAHLIHLLHPEREIKNDHNLTFGISGLSIPDAYIIEEQASKLEIIEIVDSKFKLFEDRRRYIKDIIKSPQNRYLSALEQSKILGLIDGDKLIQGRLGEYLHQINPNYPMKPLVMSNDATLVYILPSDNKPYPDLDINIKLLPLTTKEVIDFRGVLFSDLGILNSGYS